jgi:hypothetical protein
MSSQEEPEDQPPADETAEEEAPAGAEAVDDSDGDAPPTDDERIEQLTERIEKARTRAEDAGVIEDTDEEDYVESGATEEEDDQTITPPG